MPNCTNASNKFRSLTVVSLLPQWSANVLRLLAITSGASRQIQRMSTVCMYVLPVPDWHVVHFMAWRMHTYINGVSNCANKFCNDWGSWGIYYFRQYICYPVPACFRTILPAFGVPIARWRYGLSSNTFSIAHIDHCWKDSGLFFEMQSIHCELFWSPADLIVPPLALRLFECYERLFLNSYWILFQVSQTWITLSIQCRFLLWMSLYRDVCIVYTFHIFGHALLHSL